MAYSKTLLLGFLFAVSLLRSADVSARMLAETTTTENTQSVEESKYGGYYGGGHYGGGHYGGGHYGGGHYGGHYGGGHGGHGGYWPPKGETETKEQKTEVVKPEHYGDGYGGYGGYGHGGYGHGGYGGYGGHGGYGGYGHGGYGGYGHGGYGGYGHGGYGHGGYGHGGYGHWPPKETKATSTVEQKGN